MIRSAGPLFTDDTSHRFITRSDPFHPARFTPESLDDPVLNLRLGIYYLHGLKKQFQQLNLALIAYNSGPGDTQNRLENNLDLADEYASLVLNAYQRYKKIKHPAF